MPFLRHCSGAIDQGALIKGHCSGATGICQRIERQSVSIDDEFLEYTSASTITDHVAADWAHCAREYRYLRFNIDHYHGTVHRAKFAVIQRLSAIVTLNIVVTAVITNKKTPFCIPDFSAGRIGMENVWPSEVRLTETEK